MQSATNQRVITYLKRAIWVYFFLLIFEGVFRKWLLPQYSDVLLVIRDPVVLVIYILAIKARLFRRNSADHCRRRKDPATRNVLICFRRDLLRRNGRGLSALRRVDPRHLSQLV